MADILTSKRFWATTLATLALTVLCALGKLAVADLGHSIVVLTSVLVLAYGAEEAAAAHGASFPDPPAAPAVGTTVTMATVASTQKTPAETPAAKAGQ